MVLPEDSSIIPRAYKSQLLDEGFCSVDPFERFKEWFLFAQDNGVIEPDAFILSTFDGTSVNARTMVLRGISDHGLLVYTNYHSRKAKEMDDNPDVAMTFYFTEIFRQIRIKGKASRVSAEQSDQYFEARPRGSQVGSWVSRQSESLSSRRELNDMYEQFNKELGATVVRPPFWGGYEIIPHEYEFMQGYENRLHDRFRFVKKADQKFICERLWP